MTFREIDSKLLSDGFVVIDDVFTEAEVMDIVSHIDQTDYSKDTFLRTNDLFAVRQFLKEIPELRTSILSERLLEVIQELFGNHYFVVKSIYFDKPPQSNWFVAYHRDLTISVDQKADVAGYTSWLKKQNQYSVIPPAAISQGMIAVRIHLNDTDESNGALKVIPGSHLTQMTKLDNTDSQVFCNVRKGGIMLMRPLLFHASERSTNAQRRRVIHLEFSNQLLPEPLHWAEYLPLRYR